jgi:hypothetical protein
MEKCCPLSILPPIPFMFQVPTKAAGSRRCNQNFVGVCGEDPAGAWFYGCRAWAATIYAPTFLLCPSGVFALSSNQSKAFAAEPLLCKSDAHYPSFPLPTFMFQVPTKAAGSRCCNQSFVGVCGEDPAGTLFIPITGT